MSPTAFAVGLQLRPSLNKPQLASTTPQPCNIRHKSTSQIAKATIRRPENVPGNLYVDNRCIDCETCRWVAPQTFHSAGPQAAVYKQPESEALRSRAYQAMAACPTGSIHIEKPDPLVKGASRSFPTPALDASDIPIPNVYYNGFAAEGTFGASSWLLVTPHGNVMFDCPRFFEPLAKNIEKLGDVKYLVLSHSDDVAGHDVWAARLGVQRVMHADECNARQKTDQCEIKLTDDQLPFELLPGVNLIHTPGHTSGSIVMLHAESKTLFSGDHLGMSEESGQLSAFPMYNSYSWKTQEESVRMLADVDFLHVLPGHGHPFHFQSEEDRRRQIVEYADSMRGVRARIVA